MSANKPLSAMQRIHIEELRSSVQGIYSLLGEPTELCGGMPLPGKNIPAHVSKQDLRNIIGLLIEKLDKICDEDNEAGGLLAYSGGNPLNP